MLAIVYSRLGEIEKAARCYEEACRQNPGFVHRGNLDPEISRLPSVARNDNKEIPGQAGNDGR